MPWRQLLLCRRYVSIFIDVSCHANCRALAGAMKSSFQKSPTPHQTTLPHTFLHSNLMFFHDVKRSSTQRPPRLQCPPFGSSLSPSSSLLQRSKSCGHPPSQTPMDDAITNQSGVIPTTLSGTFWPSQKASELEKLISLSLDMCGWEFGGDVTDAVLPILRHCSGFLQMHSHKHEEEEDTNTYALVILNHELPLLTLFLWHKACCRICADGGANRIYDWIPTLLPDEDPIKVRKRYKPDVIKGDLDSIRPEVKEFYSGLGTKIFDNSEDQDTTDLHKCVAFAIDNVEDIKKGYVKLLVLGALGGRLDHEFANINTLYLFRGVRIVLLSEESMTFLLPKGYKHEIIIDSSVEGPHCGLLPLGGPSLSTTTTGLKWDLDKTSLQFGGLISTSNMFVSNQVIVLSDTDLLWTISIQQLQSQLKELANTLSTVPL